MAYSVCFEKFQADHDLRMLRKRDTCPTSCARRQDLSLSEDCVCKILNPSRGHTGFKSIKSLKQTEKLDILTSTFSETTGGQWTVKMFIKTAICHSLTWVHNIRMYIDWSRITSECTQQQCCLSYLDRSTITLDCMQQQCCVPNCHFPTLPGVISWRCSLSRLIFTPDWLCLHFHVVWCHMAHTLGFKDPNTTRIYSCHSLPHHKDYMLINSHRTAPPTDDKCLTGPQCCNTVLSEMSCL